ncbi:nudix hydrolase 13, mitochondrial-like [Pistacia vera]|uniref:nudix hydrolase 13, mitochondrial-like n=1 Tax=Pistacia vera TaxID=55513 RepID=UPI001262C1E8|nr:nudix hydrolase 13, mitochondrial-like [Pistacia vera]XP_031260528.1 nudix hydrolase 13, mitochondrial-like [Pistacia vera]
MSSLIARTGRHRQRYQDQLRLVSGCIPYRFQKNAKDQNCATENNVLVLMISTPNRDDLVFPKGGWENDETIGEAACREALEEAGVKGLLGENPLGVWEFRSKSKQNSCSNEGGCRGYMFVLEVTEELETWPEQANHDRKWLSVDEAFKFCRYDWMRDALKKFLMALPRDMTQGTSEMVGELPTLPVSGSESEHKRLSPGCSKKPSGLQHLEDSCTKCVVQA